MDAISTTSNALSTEYDNSTNIDQTPLTEYERFMKKAAEAEKVREDSAKEDVLSTKQGDSSECFVCVETKPNTEMWHSPCENKHLICHDCVGEYYRISIKSMLPDFAYCCGIPIWDETVQEKILGKDLTEEWLDCLKAIDNPYQIYCSTHNCWRPLNEEAHRQSSETSLLDCPKCGLGTCGWCLEPAHPDKECVVEEGEWYRRCFRCGRFAEHDGGCLNMLCECGVSFCYQCGQSLSLCESTHCGYNSRSRE